MLKALEIVGFKSFADRTRFDFPAGITVVVGPNGSGKSNIVDAIKWVLGEQSAKSLRGKDMADVIFKGSGGVAGGRKASNSAEATLIMENESRLLDFDADEVRVTRRVFRSGEAEYLLNGEACRLKDIKDMFRGTGVGTDAYSLIEQGKVDKLLQASAKDRRAIFEEAAGISRFKAKKIDAQRRLARVEQNLLRLSDIVDEVGNRYRSVKAQASKAARYKEYSERLKSLRTFTAFVDWRDISEKLSTVDSEKSQITSLIQEAAGKLETAETDVTRLESKLSGSTDESSSFEQRLSGYREQIAKIESATHYQRTRCEEWEQQSSSLQAQATVNRQRVADLQSRLNAIREENQEAELAYQSSLESAEALELQLTNSRAKYQELQLQLGDADRDRDEKNIQLQSLIGSIQTDEGELKTVVEFLSGRESRISEMESSLADVASELETLQKEEQRLAGEAESNDSALAESRRVLEEKRKEHRDRSAEISALRSEYSGVAHRAQVIEELEQRLDGVHAGVKQVLAMANDDPNTPFGRVHGLVADLIQVNVQHAPLVDMLLGDISQHVIVSSENLIQSVRSAASELSGRVGFLPLEKTDESFASKADLHGESGVIGRADKLVRFDEEYQGLIEKLLGRTWIVKTIDDVVRLRGQHNEALRFATLDGDVFEADGSATVGPQSSSLGLVSRRSELRSLKVQIHDLESKLEALQTQEKELADAVKLHHEESESLLSKQTGLAQGLADQRVRTQTAIERNEQFTQTLNGLKLEHATSFEKKTSLESSLVGHQSAVALAREAIESLLSMLTSHQSSISSLQTEIGSSEKKLNGQKVEIAKREQQLTRLEETVSELETSLNERTTASQNLADEIAEGLRLYSENQRTLLDAGSELALVYLNKDNLNQEYTRIVEQRESLLDDLRNAREVLRSQQQEIKKHETRQHDIELGASQMVHTRDAMAERMLDDYGIEVASLNAAPEGEFGEQREELEEEVNQLRRKINNIGAVNTDALVELEDLEGRYQSLDGQYQDLVQAKETLDKIINRINADSRRLFAETLEAIRQNFQVLYRRTFGGGHADIILEEGVDVLDAGIEIVATPPGKPQFNNSLLSGGEKALTAVSLLLAIFQFRPSPFCVLDEVDAPFDEANIGRFVDVLRSFLGWTKFVIVSHSKKTMTAANTLHGVTMEESGVSTRVSVRFEDVTEDGHILPTAKGRLESAPSESDTQESNSTASEQATSGPASDDDKGAA